MVSVDVKCHVYILSGMSELRSCVDFEVAVLGSPSPISLMVSVDVNHHEGKEKVQDATRL